MKKTGLIIMGLAAVMGIGSAAGVCAGTKKIIRFDEGKRVEIDVENGVAVVDESKCVACGKWCGRRNGCSRYRGSR